MIAEKMKKLVENSSVTRAMFEEGKNMAAKYGAENVFDFSLGNPNVPAPEAVKEAMKDILDTEDPVVVHGYMNNSGYEDVREAVAESINGRFGTHFNATNIVMTVGAAGGLNVILKTLLNPGDEVLTFAPYFGEYANYVNNFDGVLKAVPANIPSFQPDIRAFADMVSAKTKAVIVNTPNNPTGVIYSEETIKELARVLTNKEKELGTSIFLISDEPYRELAYDGVDVPYLTKYYHNTVVGYSFSKSLSLPGERIGYLVLPDELDDAEQMKAAANVATRILGFVNAPSLQQRAVARCLNEKCNVAFYDHNRKLFCEGLDRLGFEYVKPEGAFYLWIRTPEPDDTAFCAKAKEQHILVVPGSSFGCAGYVRAAYCVATETIEHSMPGFGKLAQAYHLSASSRKESQ